MRPSALPKLVVEPQQTYNKMERYAEYAESPYSMISSDHSRDSSGASENYSPLTQTFSFQEHHRLSDSASSLGTTPPKRDQSSDSPRASRTTLDDLVEVPDEREDGFDFCDLALTTSQCQCASPFCMRQCASVSVLERPSLDYSLADGFHSDSDAPLPMSKVRRAAGDSSVGKIATRIGSRLPSLSKRFREKGSPAQSVRSAPASRAPSRASSYRLPSMTQSFVNHVESQDQNIRPLTPPGTPNFTEAEQPQEQSHFTDIAVQSPRIEEPIDRKALASTPLLPTSMIERRGSEQDNIQSPLQSPTVADSPVFSFSRVSPSATPTLQTPTSPPLSTKPSIASFGGMHSSQVLSPPEKSSTESSRIEDKWAELLGHANFIVYPTPYMPDYCDATACKRMVEDWEEARKQFINQAARTSEHYGPTSNIYKLTEKKWTEIDGLWRRHHETAVEQAKKVDIPRGESPHEVERDYQPLAEPAPLTRLPSLNDPDNSGKFPKLDEADIVGPMVQYAQITTQASRRTAVLKFFKDMRFPGNTLGRSATGIRQ